MIAPTIRILGTPGDTITVADNGKTLWMDSNDSGYNGIDAPVFQFDSCASLLASGPFEVQIGKIGWGPGQALLRAHSGDWINDIYNGLNGSTAERRLIQEGDFETIQAYVDPNGQGRLIMKGPNNYRGMWRGRRTISRQACYQRGDAAAVGYGVNPEDHNVLYYISPLASVAAGFPAANIQVYLPDSRVVTGMNPTGGHAYMGKTWGFCLADNGAPYTASVVTRGDLGQVFRNCNGPDTVRVQINSRGSLLILQCDGEGWWPWVAPAPSIDSGTGWFVV